MLLINLLFILVLYIYGLSFVKKIINYVIKKFRYGDEW